MESLKSNFKIIIQARMGSTRLPGKMLLNIGGEKLIDIIIKRLLKVFSEKNIVLATSKNKENIPLVDAVKAYDIEIYSGSENNVLSRFVEIANIHKVKYIVRNASSTTATGNYNKHLAEQKKILEKVVRKLN